MTVKKITNYLKKNPTNVNLLDLTIRRTKEQHHEF